MRIQRSPAKDVPSAFRSGLWRIIVPIHIPDSADPYFAGQLETFSHCLESVQRTSPPNALTTIIADGCDDKALAVIKDLAKDAIDQLVVNRLNRGKIEAILGVARGTHEPLVVFLDCDSILLEGWDIAVAKIFLDFPYAGTVSLTPNPAAIRYCTSSTLIGGMTRRQLRFKSESIPFETVKQYFEGKQIPDRIPWAFRHKQIVVEDSGSFAQVGGPHFAQVLSREAINVCRYYPMNVALGRGTLTAGIDQPVDRAGFWRLAPNRPYAWHLGNTFSPEELPKLEHQESLGEESRPVKAEDFDLPRHPDPLARSIPYSLRTKIARGIMALLSRKLSD